MRTIDFGMVIGVVDDVIGDAPLYPSALLSRVPRDDFDLLHDTLNVMIHRNMDTQGIQKSNYVYSGVK